jgi:predicted nucleic acid-binding protein
MNDNAALLTGRAAARSKPKVYLETSFFTALFGAESERWRTVRDIMDDGREGRVELVISTLALVECETQAGGEAAELISSFFESEWLVRCNVDPFVANTARDLREQLSGVVPLAPNFWLHAATARWEGCGYLMTYDKRLLKLNGQSALELVQVVPPARPWDAGQMSLTDLEGVMPGNSRDLTRRSVTI